MSNILINFNKLLVKLSNNMSYYSLLGLTAATLNACTISFKYEKAKRPKHYVFTSIDDVVSSNYRGHKVAIFGSIAKLEKVSSITKYVNDDMSTYYRYNIYSLAKVMHKETTFNINFILTNSVDSIKCDSKYIEASTFFHMRNNNCVNGDSLVNAYSGLILAKKNNSTIIAKGVLDQGVLHTYELEINNKKYILLDQ